MSKDLLEFYELTTDVIDIAAVARRVVPAECGATVTLDGYARRFTKDRKTGETHCVSAVQVGKVDRWVVRPNALRHAG